VDVLLDIDGTLVRTYPIEDEFYDRALGTVGLSLPTTDYEALGASTDVSILRVLARRAWQRDPTPEEIGRVREEHTRAWVEQIRRHGIEPVAGARGVVLELRKRGLRFAAATGGFRVTAAHKLAAAGLDIEIAAAAEDGHDRPELLAHAAGTASLAAPAAPSLRSPLAETERPTYVGDGLWDAAAAEHNGLAFIGVAESDERAEAFRQRGCRVISDLAQLCDAIAK